MKITLKIFALAFLLMNYGCKGQHMVQTTKDVYLLKTNEQQFVSKPLKILLNEIKPEIKMADATRDFPDYFSFRFIDREQFRKKRTEQKPVVLFIYVKEPINWHYEKRPKGNELVWTKDDAEKYGNLTVIRIKVIGNE